MAGAAQSHRTFVIELFGKLTNVPYWGCLGADPNTEAVKTEVSDWYYTMSGDVEQMIGYFQYQFSLRGIYSGPVDGKSNQQLAEAIEKFRGMVGLPVNTKIDVELFSSYLNADHAKLQASYAAIKTAAKAADPGPGAHRLGNIVGQERRQVPPRRSDRSVRPAQPRCLRVLLHARREEQGAAILPEPVLP
jgi:peptidoglycan hydrolase-like protein with peptidoglycan-binding domain